MPTYEYKCAECGHVLEEFQPMSAQPLTQCPRCGNQSLRRVMGGGGGMIFKGQGFYLTDYKNSGGKKETKKTEAPAASGSADTPSSKDESGQKKPPKNDEKP